MEALERHVLSADCLHGGDTLVPVFDLPVVARLVMGLCRRRELFNPSDLKPEIINIQVKRLTNIRRVKKQAEVKLVAIEENGALALPAWLLAAF